MPFRLDRFERALLFMAALIMVYQLAVPPIVGIRDQGDYWRIMAPAGFRHLSEKYEDMHNFLNSKFRFEKPGWLTSGYYSSETLVARAARVLGRLVSKDGLFDIRVMGLLQGAVLLCGLAMIMSGAGGLRAPSRRVLALLLVWMFTDVGYVAFLNSFYSQTASLLFMLMATGFLALMIGRGEWRWRWWLGFVVAACLFIASKPQETPQTLLLAFVAFLAGRTLPYRGATALGVGAAISLIVVGGWFFANRPRGVADKTFYNAVFDEVLRHSPDARADLDALNLTPDLLRYRKTNAELKDSPVNEPSFRAQFYDKVGYGSLVGFYATHPWRLWESIKRRSPLAFTLVTHYGNFEKSTGLPEGTQSQAFKTWSDLKKKLLPGTPWMLGGLFMGNIVGAAVLGWWSRLSGLQRLGLAAFAVLNVMAVGAFLICAVADSMDSIRQLYAFNAMTDLCLAGRCRLRGGSGIAGI
jgi:hypothetical protein